MLTYHLLSSAVYEYLKSTEFQDLAKALAAVGIALTAIGVIWQRIFKPLFKGMKIAYDSILKIEELHPVLLTIAAQFKNNGGSSLKDSVDRIERKADTSLVNAKIAINAVNTLTEALASRPCNSKSSCPLIPEPIVFQEVPPFRQKHD